MTLKIYISFPLSMLESPENMAALQVKIMNLALYLALMGVKTKIYAPQKHMEQLFPRPSVGEKRLKRKICDEILRDCDAVYVCGGRTAAVRKEIRLAQEKNLFLIRENFLKEDVLKIIEKEASINEHH